MFRLRWDGEVPLPFLSRVLQQQADRGLPQGLQQQVQQRDLLQHFQLRVRVGRVTT